MAHSVFKQANFVVKVRMWKLFLPSSYGSHIAVAKTLMVNACFLYFMGYITVLFNGMMRYPIM